MGRTDEDDWRDAVAGNGEAFGRVFDRHRSRLRRHVHGLVDDHDDADDAVALTFLETWRHRSRVRFVDGSILPWLLRTATNVAHNLARSSRRYSAVIARLPPDPSPPDPAEGDFDDGPAVASLKLLPLEQRHVVTLCVIEGLTTDEAASALGVRPGTVKSRLSRAKASLRQHLSPPQHQTKEAIDEL